MRNSNTNYLDKKWYTILLEIYGQEGLDLIINKYEEIKQSSNSKIQNRLTEKDVFAITYADSIKTDKPDLSVVADALNKTYPGINNIHYLPFFKWTSDDGFSVSDYEVIDPRYGQWDDLKKIDKKYKFMFDFVINHSSKSNPWFTKFLNGEKGFEKFYVEKEEGFDTTKVVRPRTSPLFHEYGNNKVVWSTFSEDQVDLNFKAPEVFAKSIELLGLYVSHGMTTIRLDAIGFLWKESGHTCMHHENTHALIKAMKMMCNDLFGELIFISEVNVPHDENMTYLGDNGDESDLVYNFALPPLMAFTLLKGDATKMKNWMRFFDELKSNETMFNFLASHDGVGMRPVETILSKEEKEMLVDKVKAANGRLNYKSLPDGSQTVYEMNNTYVDFIFTEDGSENDYKKLLLAHSLLLYFRGIPAIYINSLFARRNWVEGIALTGMNRTINRRKYEFTEINEILKDSNVSSFIASMNSAIDVRKQNEDFSPYAKQELINDLPKEVIGFRRGEKTAVFANISNAKVSFTYDSKEVILEAYEVKVIEGNI